MSELVFDHTAHKKLWDWLSKNPCERKEDWPGWCDNGGSYSHPVNLCFACDYAYNGYACLERFDWDRICLHCPIEWPGGGYCEESVYGEWSGMIPYSSLLSNATSLAERIRDLPIREGVKCR